ncbi:hypothetical protein F4779DRAFT_605597 [Xylariaceae sp. FL0662B]|nr:hypothetical protein F4779DRAFT_605597 [Xylariaceae sp. FL0662B]
MSELLRRAGSSGSPLLRNRGILRAARLSLTSTPWAHSVNRVSRPAQLYRSLGRRHYHGQRDLSYWQDLMRSRLPPTSIIIWSFIGANCLVFLFWVQARIEAGQGRFERIKRMHKNYTLSIDSVREGHWYTFLTSAISHRDLGHLLFNMISFHAFASAAVFAGLNTRMMLVLGLGSAIVSGVASVLDWERKGETNVHGLGASGVVTGVGAAVACMVPHMPFQIFFVPVDIPIWLLMVLYICYDSYKLNSENSQVGHAAHLGGAAFGALFGVFGRRRMDAIARVLPFRSLARRRRLPSSSSPLRPPVPNQPRSGTPRKGKPADKNISGKQGGAPKPGEGR